MSSSFEEAPAASSSDELETDDSHSPDERPKTLQGGPRTAPKRPHPDDFILPSLKRQKGTVNEEYLGLLNREIEEAARPGCPASEPQLDDQHIALSHWTSLEKEICLAVAARVGPVDARRIAQALGTKTELEVRSYLRHVHDAACEKEESLELPRLDLKSVPVAVELSESCCRALEEAADSISVRQEMYEETCEEAKWGKYWNFTRPVANTIDEGTGASADNLAFARFFHVSEWVHLSETIFMNGPPPDANWRFIDQRPPSIWATALDDFYSLAVSMLQRLIQTTLFVSKSRIRSKRDLVPPPKKLVRKEDVEAAAASLGLAVNSRKFWVECPRRLRLEVQSDEPLEALKAYTGGPRNYDAVEQYLSTLDDGVSDEDEDEDENEENGRNDLPVSMARVEGEGSPSPDGRSGNSEHEGSEAQKVSSQTESSDESGEDSGDDSNTENHDERCNQAEEAALWNLLGLERPPAPVEESR